MKMVVYISDIDEKFLEEKIEILKKNYGDKCVPVSPAFLPEPWRSDSESRLELLSRCDALFIHHQNWNENMLCCLEYDLARKLKIAIISSHDKLYWAYKRFKEKNS